jgi:hypothetical protein
MRFDLSDEEWALLVPLLPKNRKSARVLRSIKLLNRIEQFLLHFRYRPNALLFRPKPPAFRLDSTPWPAARRWRRRAPK